MRTRFLKDAASKRKDSSMKRPLSEGACIKTGDHIDLAQDHGELKLSTISTETENSAPSDRLRLFREHLELDQKTLAAKIGISPGVLGFAERGDRPPSRRLLEGLFQHFGLSSDWVMYGKGRVLLPKEQLQGCFTELGGARSGDGERLRQYREAIGLTQSSLAEALGVSQGFVGKIEAGRAGLSRDFLGRLAHISDVDLRWLIGAPPVEPQCVSPEAESAEQAGAPSGVCPGCGEARLAPQPGQPIATDRALGFICPIQAKADVKRLEASRITQFCDQVAEIEAGGHKPLRLSRASLFLRKLKGVFSDRIVRNGDHCEK